MSEREFTTKPTDERNEVKRLKAQLAAAELDVSQKENFGKFDVSVPNVGEDTYQSYFDKRPSDGVIRDGDKLRNAASGKFASMDDYDASNSTTAEYDNKQLERQSEGDIAYEDMTLQDLARKYGESEALNDRTIASDVLEVIDEKVNLMASKYGWAKEQKDTHYAQLMDIAEKVSRAGNSEPETEAQDDSFDSVAAVSATDTSDSDPIVNGDESVDDLSQLESADVPTIDNLNDVVLSPILKTELEIDDLADVELAEVPKVEDEELDTSGLDPEKESIWKRIRNKSNDLYYKAGAMFSTGMYRLGNAFPKPTQETDETNEAFEKRVKRRGMYKVVGLVAVAAVVIVAAKYGIDHANAAQNSPDISNGINPGHYNGTPDSQDLVKLPGTVVPPVGREFGLDAMTIKPGEGFYQTFKDMGIPKTEWANLLTKVGPKLKELGWAYPMPGGSWGISHSGQIPSSVLESIMNNR